MTKLTKTQLEALDNVRKRTIELNPVAEKIISKIFNDNNIDLIYIEKILDNIKNNAQILIHFHPDRLGRNNKTVAQLLYEEGIYRNQFETGLSNGGLTAFSGGQRDKWEEDLFGGVYQNKEAKISERPKYGALDLLNFSDGAAPRFGSCYFRLKNQVSQIASFTNKDSCYSPKHFGTIENFINILAALFEELIKDNQVLGIKNLSLLEFIDQLININNKLNNNIYSRNLDDYIEAQIHGFIELEEDVQTLVADPSFKNTDTGHYLTLISERYNIKLEWHGGFQIATSQIPDEFRGKKIPLLAKRLVGSGIVNTRVLGEAEFSLKNNSEEWLDFGTYEEVRQYIKQLWHVLAYYGEPYT